MEKILSELINKNKEATKFGDAFNREVTLRIREPTLPATIELCTQRYVATPGLGLDPKVAGYDRILQSMCYH